MGDNPTNMIIMSQIQEEVKRRRLAVERDVNHDCDDASPIKESDHHDVANGRRIARLFGNKIRYVAEQNQFYLWERGVWRRDVAGKINQYAKDAARSIYGEAAKLKRDSDRSARVQWAEASHSAAKIASAIEMVKSEHPIPVALLDFDSDPYLLNFSDGTLDVRQGVLRPANPADLITASTGYAFGQSDVEPVRWLAFLNRIFDGNSELIDFTQTLFGLSLIGEQREHLFVVLFGSGANGKGVFTQVWRDMLGNYAMAGKHGFMMASKGHHPTELADLFGKRLVTIDETKDGVSLDEGLVKAVTGGSPIRARRMREDHWQFQPSHLTVLLTNHRPTIKGTDNGIWRRLKLIPFAVTIPENERDTQLAKKLRAELPAIANWALKGALRYQQSGLHTPDLVSAATNAYRAQSDSFRLWFNDCMSQVSGAEVRAKVAVESYQRWCKEHGEVALRSRSFSDRMVQMTTGSRQSNGTIYLGIRLKTAR